MSQPKPFTIRKIFSEEKSPLEGKIWCSSGYLEFDKERLLRFVNTKYRSSISLETEGLELKYKVQGCEHKISLSAGQAEVLLRKAGLAEYTDLVEEYQGTRRYYSQEEYARVHTRAFSSLVEVWKPSEELEVSRSVYLIGEEPKNLFYQEFAVRAGKDIDSLMISWVASFVASGSSLATKRESIARVSDNVKMEGVELDELVISFRNPGESPGGLLQVALSATDRATLEINTKVDPKFPDRLHHELRLTLTINDIGKGNVFSSPTILLVHECLPELPMAPTLVLISDRQWESFVSLATALQNPNEATEAFPPHSRIGRVYRPYMLWFDEERGISPEDFEIIETIPLLNRIVVVGNIPANHFKLLVLSWLRHLKAGHAKIGTVGFTAIIPDPGVAEKVLVALGELKPLVERERKRAAEELKVSPTEIGLPISVAPTGELSEDTVSLIARKLWKEFAFDTEKEADYLFIVADDYPIVSAAIPLMRYLNGLPMILPSQKQEGNDSMQERICDIERNLRLGSKRVFIIGNFDNTYPELHEILSGRGYRPCKLAGNGAHEFAKTIAELLIRYKILDKFMLAASAGKVEDEILTTLGDRGRSLLSILLEKRARGEAVSLDELEELYNTFPESVYHQAYRKLLDENAVSSIVITSLPTEERFHTAFNAAFFAASKRTPLLFINNPVEHLSEKVNDFLSEAEQFPYKLTEKCVAEVEGKFEGSLQDIGREIYTLIPQKTREVLERLEAHRECRLYVCLIPDDSSVPYELAYNGEYWALKNLIGRICGTDHYSTARIICRISMKASSFRGEDLNVLLLGSPGGSLPPFEYLPYVESEIALLRDFFESPQRFFDPAKSQQTKGVMMVSEPSALALMSDLVGEYYRMSRVRVLAMTGPQLTSTEFMEKANQAPDLIHYAGHVSYESVPHRWSSLMFSDEMLDAVDIGRHLHLTRGPLVFINACSSARGAGPAIMGITGLAEAFFRAGARCYVGTLWSVLDDEARLMAMNFYLNLLIGRPVGRSLFEARKSTRYGIQLTQMRKGISWPSWMLYGDPEDLFLRHWVM